MNSRSDALVQNETQGPSATLRARLMRTLVLRRFRQLHTGCLIVDDGAQSCEFGDPLASLRCRIRVNAPSFYETLALRGSVGAGEAYTEGVWECDDLVALVRLLVLNREVLDSIEHGFARLGAAALQVWHGLRRNTLAGSRRNIAAHYDLGNEFFALFLSPDLMYSSAIWEGGEDTLEKASYRKLQRVCRQLSLADTDHVLEIGSGWGGFALHAARHHGCRVTTTTISKEQYRLCCERVRAAGLEGRVTVLLQDYRTLIGEYDKLVSIEMIEAVGAQFLPDFFTRLTLLLKPTGLALLQAITIEDHRYAQALASVDFIKRHVFPGSFIPSIAALLEAKTRVSDLALLEQRDYGLSYARTLGAWRANFHRHVEQVRALNLDDRFIRLWDFYLAYCEGGFRERAIGVSQLLFARPGYRPAAC